MGVDFYVLMAVLIVCSIAINRYLSHRRSQSVKAIAAHLNFTYCGHLRQPLSHQINQSEICSKGRNRQYKNFIQGEVDSLSVAVGDYAYTTGGGKNRRTHYQTIACVESRQAHFPHFVLKPENIFHRIGGVFGYQDIDFDSHPQFSSAYCLQGPNEAAIRDCFTPSVLTFFQNHQDLHVESTGTALIYYRPRYTVSPKAWPQLINTVCRVQQQF